MLKPFRTSLLALAGVCFLLGAAATIADVVLRWTTGGNINGVIELTTFLIGFGALLSMPVCYEQQSHVAAKLLSEMNPRRFARPLGALSALASLGFAAIIFWIMARNTSGKIGTPETSRDLLLPMDLLLAIVCATLLLSVLCAVIAVVRALRAEASNV